MGYTPSVLIVLSVLLGSNAVFGGSFGDRPPFHGGFPPLIVFGSYDYSDGQTRLTLQIKPNGTAVFRQTLLASSDSSEEALPLGATTTAAGIWTWADKHKEELIFQGVAHSGQTRGRFMEGLLPQQAIESMVNYQGSGREIAALNIRFKPIQTKEGLALVDVSGPSSRMLMREVEKRSSWRDHLTNGGWLLGAVIAGWLVGRRSTRFKSSFHSSISASR